MSIRKEYNEYKPTSIMGINKIPSHWVESKFRYVTEVLTDYTANGSFKSLADNVEYLSEPDYARLIRLTDLRLNLSNDGIYVNEDSYNFLKKSALFGGEYLIANVGAYAGLVVQMPKYDGVATLGPNMMMARFDEKKVLVKFMVYISNSEYIQKQLLLKATASSAQPKLNKEDFRSVEFIYPKIDEQKCIVRYLDNKVGQIDKLLDEKKKLVLLLEEKRQAMITEAVTKGLNPNVKMKDSGVEWIGEIPEHWEVIALKRLSKRIEVGIAEAATHAYRDSGVPIIRSTNIKNGKINQDNLLYIDEEFAEKNRSKFILKNDLLTVRTGNAGLTGVVPSNLDFSQCFTMLITTLKANINPYYYSYYLNALPGKAYFEITAWGTAQKNISVPILQECPVFKVDVEEQNMIVEFISVESEKLEKLIKNTERQIQKLKEYCQSLIYEAVTGKIDVRDFEEER